MKKLIYISMVLIICTAFTGCSRKGDIVPSLKFNKNVATMGSILKADYSFSIPQNAKIPDYNGIVFVHFIDPDGNIVFTDDHETDKPITQWKTGDTYSYQRLIYVPAEILSGEYTVKLGIYDPEGKKERIPLNAQEINDRSYEVAKLSIKAPLWDLVKYDEGWHEIERSPEDPFIQWRWTKDKSIAHLLNPLKDTKLYLEVEGNPEYFTEQELMITIKINDNQIDQFPAENKKRIMRIIPLSKDLAGNDKYIKFEIDLGKTFIPSQTYNSTDIRELGIKVYRIIIEDW
ncbi:MAG: hypothetical protein A2Y62_15555 [Candidatus Fischerbacteria bacterium RBG_13_37_8]|uniref:Uncharacterized protein n=1 Tax=Candidatus Fischerbacteria bacterium RBG_13_37_8 TaxID=1817863 RepID=A0A1F5VKT3_9BACT|nr:MAG: hypothetical protein A2Y62_15555 [Candidatus Fischerbacteria bacterium RBG_13_37_8]